MNEERSLRRWYGERTLRERWTPAKIYTPEEVGALVARGAARWRNCDMPIRRHGDGATAYVGLWIRMGDVPYEFTVEGDDEVAVSCACEVLARALDEPARIRLMRGQVVVRELDAPPSAVLWTPERGPRQVTTHRGVVIGLGPPARLTEHPSSPEVPHGFGVGDVVQYHFGAMGTQVARTRAWVDGEPATWLTQVEIDAVWEFGFDLGAMIDRADGGTTEPVSMTLAEIAELVAPDGPLDGPPPRLDFSPTKILYEQGPHQVRFW